MRTLVGMVLVWAMVLAVRTLYLDPTGVIGFAKYDGMSAGTKIVVNIPVVDVELELPRFPLDVLVYAPVKLVSYVDLNVVDERDDIEPRRVFLTEAMKSEHAFAFCYLRMLWEGEQDLPLKYASKDINYDLTGAAGEETAFNLATVDIESLAEKELDSLMRAMTVQAQRDTNKISDPTENCIVEVSLGQETRYLWGYHLAGGYLYVFDPEAPQLLYARVKVKDGVYQVGLNNYVVRSYIGKVSGQDGV